MKTPLLAMLFLVSGAQVADEGPKPAVPRRVVVVSLLVDHERREIAVSWAAPPPKVDPDDDFQDPRPRGPINLNTATVEPENFDRWLFPDERSAAERRRHLTELLDAKIELADFGRMLTAKDRAKLRLAGRGDIKRFFDLIEDRRHDFELERKSWKTGFAALKRLEPITQVYQEGPFGEGSLFAKTLRRIEDGRAGR